jgi:hypothetical protein
MIAVYPLVGIGIAAGTVLPGALVLANWFTARRGMAMGIANAGSTTGGMVMTWSRATPFAIANEASASAKKKTAAAKPKGAPASKTGKAAGRPPRSSRAKSNDEKLICRYCGSDDLAPSFRRRRDARCGQH